MQIVRDLIDLSEHCPECGALVVRAGRVKLCPHCDCEVEVPEEPFRARLIRFSPGEPGSSLLEHDDRAPDLSEEAA